MTVLASVMRPSSTIARASSSGMRATTMCSSSTPWRSSGTSCEARGHVDHHRLVAEPRRVVERDAGARAARPAARPPRPARGRAVRSAGSPSTSRRPAGISHTSASRAARYWRTSVTVPSSCIGTTRPRPGGGRPRARGGGRRALDLRDGHPRSAGPCQAACSPSDAEVGAVLRPSLTGATGRAAARRPGTGGAGGPRPGRAPAPTNSRNSGAGRLGRLLNSGWAWVPTQNGWLGSSMNSTSRPSGDAPEHTKPEPSNLPR